MKRSGLFAVSALALAACEPESPDSAAGVGFGNYHEYASAQERARAARDAQLSDYTVVHPPEATGAPAASSSQDTAVTSADLAAAGIGAPVPAQNTVTPTATSASQPAIGAPLAPTAIGAAYVSGDHPTISDEQNFAAVSARETIQSDAERLARQKAQYEAVSPTDVPDRPGSTGPDIAAYALNSSNPVGQQVYRRTFPSASRAARKCAGYRSDDLAQLAFLEAGGPQKDRHGLDPDGDGYACNWDPGLYRRAVGG